MKMRYWRGAVIAFGAATLGVAALAAPSAQAEAVVTHSNDTVDVTNFPVTLGTCVNSGNGELLLLTGTVHNASSLRTDAQGGFHATLHTNLVNMSGVGTSSGDSYRVADTAGQFGSRTDAYFPPGSASPRTVTQSFDVRFISTGSGDNLLIRDTFHLTINANGDVTVDKPTFEEICVG